MLITGCKPLDSLLGGDLPKRTITQIYGPAGSGKTNVCLQALHLCTKNGGKAIFIDTDGSFCKKRLEQICGNNLERALKNVFLFEVNDFSGQTAAIASIEKLPADLIIVDSITSLYRLETNDNTFHETSRELGKQLCMLLRHAREKGTPVLVTNQVYSDINSGRVEPIGGDVLKYYSKIIIELQKEHNGIRKAILKKHVFKKEGESASFAITEKGLAECKK